MGQKTYHVHEWTPELIVAANEIISKIKQSAPGLEVLFMGAGALGLPGKNDIDLDILCSSKELKKYTGLISQALGSQAEIKDGKAIWNYTYKGFEVDALLSDPSAPNSHIQRQKKNFEILKARPDLQSRYTQLKIECDGLPYSQYESLKGAFLDQVPDL